MPERPGRDQEADVLERVDVGAPQRASFFGCQTESVVLDLEGSPLIAGYRARRDNSDGVPRADEFYGSLEFSAGSYMRCVVERGGDMTVAGGGM